MPRKNNQPQQLTSYSYYSNSPPCTITIINSYKGCLTVHKKEICTLKLCKSSRVKIQHVADKMVGFIPRIHGCWLQYGKELERREFRICRSFAFFVFVFSFFGILDSGSGFLLSIMRGTWGQATMDEVLVKFGYTCGWLQELNRK